VPFASHFPCWWSVEISIRGFAVGKYSKLRGKILSGTADSNIEFRELCRLLIRLGFEERVRGDHHIFVKENIAEIINLQPNGSKMKVPELPGCMADGMTYEEAITNAQRVIEEWVETAHSLGRPVPEPKGRLMYA
jgi:predicted RNase H-like HicB family nuclease/predicted RNA binding protein YcfA (HicA-like mRNA interferase family)